MPDILTEEYRDGLRQGQILIQKCSACDELTMYPKYACPACQSEELIWQAAEGTGVLCSYTVSRAAVPSGFEADLPYALVVVKLDEGVQMLGRLIPDADGEWDEYKFDRPLEHVHIPDDERPIAWFRRREN